MTARVAKSTAGPELLEAGFDAFEAIRQVARACENRAPALFATFMLTAGTAVEGRNALNNAPSLPPLRSGPAPASAVSVAADVGDIADQLAELAACLAQRLAEAGAQADLPNDRAACQHASRAAADIHQLLGRPG